MMRLGKIITLAILGALLLPSCSKENPLLNNDYPTDLPVVLIHTVGKLPIDSKTEYIDGYIQFLDPLKQCSAMTLFKGPMKIRGRGTTSWTAEKKPYRFVLEDSVPLLGLPADKDWYLLAEYYDKTLLRNRVAMEMSRICGMKWTPEMVSVEVYLNEEYVGVYTLSEAREITDDKVNISPAYGDCYMELEQNMDKPACFWTDHLLPVTFYDPQNPSSELKSSIKKQFNDFEKVLYSESFNDPVKGYSSLIDVESVINYYIIEELSKNIDGNLRKSTFITLGQNRKIDFYHVWDFDRAFGNCTYMNVEYPGATNTYEGWFIRNQTLKHNTGWYERFFSDPAFTEALKNRWIEVFPQLCEIPDYIDELAKTMDGPQQRNFKRWELLNRSYSSYIDSFTTFYKQRLEWLDKEIRAL